MTVAKFRVNDDMPKKSVDGMTVFNTNTVNALKQPMFFGAPLGVQRYDQYKYPVFEKLTQQQLGYFWRPEEVSLQKDRADYQTLRPEQKHIFTSILSTRSSWILYKGVVLGWLCPYCSLPEPRCHEHLADYGDDS